MTESQAWREIASRRVGNPRRYEKHGLCYQIFELKEEGLDVNTAKWMLCRIMRAVPINPRTKRERMHAYPATPRNKYASEGRTFAALWFALDAEYEEQQVRFWNPIFYTRMVPM